ncbi:hypothetical protein GGR53DRAFT_483632, partial [Hypoxylon sp. FL1150]
MWHHVDDLSRQPFTNISHQVGDHIMRMVFQLSRRIASPPKDVWIALEKLEKTDNDAYKVEERRIDGIFEAFQALIPNKTPATAQECLVLTKRSKQLLVEAAVALRMPTHVVSMSSDVLINDKIRPTYVDFNHGSWEFFYGIGGRPGLVHLAERLGNSSATQDPGQKDNIEKM